MLKTKAFIFNAVTVLVCVLTAVIIPKLVGEIKADTNTGDTAAFTAPAKDGRAAGSEDGEQNVTEPEELDSVIGTPFAEMALNATRLTTIDGVELWQLSVLDANTDAVIKPWPEIYGEWKTDETVLDLGGGDFTVHPGGLEHTAGGDYSVTVRYNNGSETLSVPLKKSEPLFS